MPSDPSAGRPAASRPGRVPRRVHLSRAGVAAEVVEDGRGGGWTLLIGGIEQSHVDLDDPRRIEHEYLRRIANVLDTLRPAGAPISVAHLGGGALTLARYVQATRPGSPQLVVEIERELTTLVTAALPLPPGTDLRVITGDAREELAALPDERFDAVVLDVFSGEESPGHLAARDFYREALGHLDPDGILLVNVGDDAGQRFAARQLRELEAASLAAGVAGVWMLTHATLLTRPADGNMVLLAGGGLGHGSGTGGGAGTGTSGGAARIRPRARGTRADGTSDAERRSTEELRRAWAAAGPHPAAVLDPLQAAAFADDRLR